MGLFDSIRRVVGGGQSATDESDGQAGDDEQSGLVDTSTLDVATLRERAEAVAGEVEQLDFSLDSLAQFDAAIDAGYDEALPTASDPTTYPTDVVRFGCYLGEVLIRVYGAEWTHDPDWGVTLTGPDGSTTVAVFEVAARSIRSESVFAAVAAWPFIDRTPEPTHFTADPLARPWQTAVGVGAVAFIMIASIAGMNNILAGQVLETTTDVVNPILTAALLGVPPLFAAITYLLLRDGAEADESGGDGAATTPTPGGGGDD